MVPAHGQAEGRATSEGPAPHNACGEGRRGPPTARVECCSSARRDGLRDARPQVTEWSEESEDGKAVHEAQGHRGSTTAGEGGVRPVVLKRWSVPTGEPCHTETIPHGSVGGRGKRRVSYLARGLPNPLRRSRFRQQVIASVRGLTKISGQGPNDVHYGAIGLSLKAIRGGTWLF